MYNFVVLLSGPSRFINWMIYVQYVPRYVYTVRTLMCFLVVMYQTVVCRFLRVILPVLVQPYDYQDSNEVTMNAMGNKPQYSTVNSKYAKWGTIKLWLCCTGCSVVSESLSKWQRLYIQYIQKQVFWNTMIVATFLLWCGIVNGQFVVG